ncbi:MAG TPA: DUF3011 domain-containing protein, partial [Candidatus Polarisedimenticolia bacterium]|nr:DUF3011 domain-containing protein [Candidatus Polarisedimenticolia bacterium]
MHRHGRFVVGALFVALARVLLGGVSAPRAAEDPPLVPRVACSSKPGGRQHCPAGTAKGVALVRSSGDAPCLLGKTWGYDDDGIWVSDGCVGEFVVGEGLSAAAEKAATEKPPAKKRSPQYVPNIGFLLVEGDMGQIYMRLYTYFRYLNQTGLDPTYTDSFGTVKTVQQRQDFQLNKFFLPFYGWFMDPRFKYFLYIWSSNPAQGEPAQVV